MKRKCAALLSLTLAVSLLTGCWDFSEPEESGLVTVLGIDEAEGGNFRVVFQDESLIPGNQMFQASNWNFDIHCGTGSTVFTALQQNLRTNPERAYLAHTKAIIVSEGLVRSQGIGPVIDFLERTPMIRKNTLFLIAKQGEFDKVFLPDAKQDKDTGVIIQKILNEKKSSTFLVQTDLGEFLGLYWGPFTSPYALGVGSTRFYLDHKSLEQHYQNAGFETYNIDVGDIAVFKGEKMAGWLTGDENRGFLWAKGLIGGGYIDVLWDGKPVTLRILRASSNIKPSVVNGKMRIDINIRTEGNITESKANINFGDTEVMDKIKNLLNQEVEKEVREAIGSSKKLSVDFMGFGNCFFMNYPNYWKTVAPKWPGLCSEMEFNVQVISQIQYNGLIKRPAKPS